MHCIACKGCWCIRKPDPFTIDVYKRQAPLQAASGQGGELDFNHIEPTGGFWDLMEGEALGERKSLIGRQVLIERTDVMGVEMVLHEMDGAAVDGSVRRAG